MINRILTKIPQVKLRGLGQATQRQVTSPRKWREYKGNVQTTAGRSFDVLKYNLLRNLNKMFNNYTNYTNNIVASIFIKDDDSENKINYKKSVIDSQIYNYNMIFVMELDKVIKSAYRKSYMLGLKASGVTLYQRNTTFKKTSLPTLEVGESEWLNQTIFEKLEAFKDLLEKKGNKLLKQIEIELLRFYQYGRIIGAPLYSFVYFNCDSNNPECQDLINASPWPREKVNDFYPCCRFKVIPVTASEYRERLIDF